MKTMVLFHRMRERVDMVNARAITFRGGSFGDASPSAFAPLSSTSIWPRKKSASIMNLLPDPAERSSSSVKNPQKLSTLEG